MGGEEEEEGEAEEPRLTMEVAGRGAEGKNSIPPS